jgi:small subunit ribosomal protein S18
MMRKKRARQNRAGNTGLHFSYKNVDSLKRFINEQGSIVSRLETGLKQKEQRRLAREIKRARHLALLPFTQTV